MKPLRKAPATRSSKEQPAFLAHSQAAAKAMSKKLRAEQKRWNLPLLIRKDGKDVAVKP
jgi:hypothetical protein